MSKRLSIWTAGAAIALALSWMPTPASAGGGATGSGGAVRHGYRGQDTITASLPARTDRQTDQQ